MRLPKVTSIAANRNLTFFFIIAFAFSWLVFLPMIFFHAPIEFTVLASFGPSVAALTTHRLATGSYRPFRIYTTWLRSLSVSAFGIALVALAYVILPGVTTADPHKLNWSILTSLSVYNYSTLLGGPLGEEPGCETMHCLGSKRIIQKATGSAHHPERCPSCVQSPVD